VSVRERPQETAFVAHQMHDAAVDPGDQDGRRSGVLIPWNPRIVPEDLQKIVEKTSERLF
jgi:hypothetical protein